VTAVSAFSLGDVYGFAALFLIALTAALMLLRSRLLKLTRNIALIRTTHLAISVLAGFFLILHISTLFLPPISNGVLLGYAAIIVSVIVWMTGTAFLQKVKDSLFFHGVLSSVLIPLSMIHAATASTNIPSSLSELLLLGTTAVVLANAALHVKRALASLPHR
jgi:hypothetical protein